MEQKWKMPHCKRPQTKRTTASISCYNYNISKVVFKAIKLWYNE